jgi:ppGpp synthetase/RelA/SpoT-type nucleotidyltranferase
MGLPISRTQLDKLGERIAAADIIADDDYGTLEQVLDTYDEVLQRAESRVREVGYRTTSRLKTSGTLVDKLRRESGMKLKAVQDIAGIRVVVPGGRSEHDDAVTDVSRAFSGTGKAPRLRDRRDQPSSGYRAVHVVVFEENLPVEVLQNMRREG